MLFQQLKKEYGAFSLPEFPKKKLLSLSPEEVEQRRIMLERYIQIGQHICQAFRFYQDHSDFFFMIFNKIQMSRLEIQIFFRWNLSEISL